MAKHVIHIQAHRSFWSGRITALCGLVAERGTWARPWLSGANCPACKRIDKQHKQDTKERRR